jgi:hypothetical protein
MLPSGYFATLKDLILRQKIPSTVERNGGRKGTALLAGDGGEHTSARGTRYDEGGRW